MPVYHYNAVTFPERRLDPRLKITVIGARRPGALTHHLPVAAGTTFDLSNEADLANRYLIQTGNEISAQIVQDSIIPFLKKILTTRRYANIQINQGEYWYFYELSPEPSSAELTQLINDGKDLQNTVLDQTDSP